MLPKLHYYPFVRPKILSNYSSSFLIVVNLIFPVLSISSWCLVAFLASVPEATIYEDSNLLGLVGYVRGSEYCPVMDSVTFAFFPKYLSYGQFRSGILSSYAGHHLATLFS